jgi:hypothetical protein
MKTKTIKGVRYEMMEVAVFSGKTKKPWFVMDVPELWMEYLKQIARRQHKSLDAIFERAMRQHLRTEERRLGLA